VGTPEADQDLWGIYEEREVGSADVERAYKTELPLHPLPLLYTMWRTQEQKLF
jgi:hypothetical protein